MKVNKTNAMRLLDAGGIKYEPLEYEYSEDDLSGEHVADAIGIPYERCFKTLTARGDRTGIVVFCIPVGTEIDLKAAQHSGNKRVELLHVKELLAATGYIRGGTSPIGMKKKFPVYINSSAVLYDKITVSAGVRGMQLLLSSGELIGFTDAVVCDLLCVTKEKSSNDEQA